MSRFQFEILALTLAFYAVFTLGVHHNHHHHKEASPVASNASVATVVCVPKKKVLWFMAVQSYSKAVESAYYKFVLAAVNSAKAFAPSLAPFIIHGGDEKEIPAFVRNLPNIKLVSHNLTFASNLTEALGKQSVLGAWYRFDIPYIVKHVLTDLSADEYDLDYALYTDTDVLLFRDFTECSLPKPNVLYIGPEGKRAVPWNSGVLYMNLTAMQEHWPNVLELAVKKKFNFAAVDQGLFIEYFVEGNYSTLLPDQYNWKGYWGGADDVVIAHFHGPKPGKCLDCLLIFRDHYRSICECPPVYFSVFDQTVDHGKFYERMLYAHKNFTHHDA